jgi:hypothetical protein
MGMVAVNLGGRTGRHTAPLHVHTLPGQVQAARIRFELPGTTAPGTYEGDVQVDDTTYSLVAEVEPRTYLLISPSRLTLEATAGTEVGAEVTLVNAGNVSCEIGKAYTFRLFDNDSFDRGLGAALRSDSGTGLKRIDRLVEELAESHGGLVRVNIRDGAGTINPGERREIALELKFSDRLKDGRTYFGTWSLYNLNYYIRVHAGPVSRRSN